MSSHLTPDSPAPYGRPFVVIATQRTGSTLLVRSLDASPLIFCAGEIFHDGPHVHHAEYRYRRQLFGLRLFGDTADLLFRTKRIRAHLDHFYASAGAGVRAAGFKVMTSQLRRYRSLLPILTDFGVMRFFLHRKDSFAAALSNYRARVSGVYHSDRAHAIPDGVAISADVDEFRALLDRSESAKRELLSLHAAHGGLLLAYEDMLDDWDAFTASVGVGLGIDDLRLAMVLDKLGTAASKIRIDNEDMLRCRFGADS